MSNFSEQLSSLRFHRNSGPFSIQEIAKIIGATVYKAGKKIEALAENIKVYEIKTLKDATSKDLTFFSHNKYIEDFAKTEAIACITTEKYATSSEPLNTYILSVDNPQIAYAKALAMFYDSVEEPEFEINSKVGGKDCRISTSAYIGKNVVIGDNVIIYPNTYIGNNVVIGDNTIIYDCVSIKNCIVGKNCIIHSGARIGQDGFGYATEYGKHFKIPQIGRVIIGNDVEIGASTTIDRGSLGDTVIGDGCKIDNLVQIGHNVKMGKGCIIVAQTGISGSVKLGNYVVLGGQVGIADNLSLGDGAQVGAQSGVMRDILPGERMFGSPAQSARESFKQLAILKKLSNMKKYE